MKRMVMMMCAVLFTFQIFAQNPQIKIGKKQFPIQLAIAFNKTTNLVFPFGIKSVDRGSAEILLQKAAGAENVLQVKAAKKDFTQTNLTVITSEGQLWSFLLNYAAEPTDLTIRLETLNTENPVVEFSSPDDNEGVLKENSEKVATKNPMIRNLRNKDFDVQLSLTGIYIKDDALYFQVRLNNWSNINYSIDQLRFFINDQKRSKRTSSQETELHPLKVSGNDKVINGKSSQVVVVAIPKFTIPDQKILTIQLMEAHGGRHLSIRVKNKQLIRVHPL